MSTRPTAIEYPERASRGLVLVKWWLLALPRCITVGLLAGDVSTRPGALAARTSPASGGLIGILVQIAG